MAAKTSTFYKPDPTTAYPGFLGLHITFNEHLGIVACSLEHAYSKETTCVELKCVGVRTNYPILTSINLVKTNTSDTGPNELAVDLSSFGVTEAKPRKFRIKIFKVIYLFEYPTPPPTPEPFDFKQLLNVFYSPCRQFVILPLKACLPGADPGFSLIYLDAPDGKPLRRFEIKDFEQVKYDTPCVAWTQPLSNAQMRFSIPYLNGNVAIIKTFDLTNRFTIFTLEESTF